MTPSRDSIPAEKLAELLRERLRSTTVERLLNHSDKQMAITRRIHDILHGKVQLVSPRVADDICTTIGRPDWLQLLQD